MQRDYAALAKLVVPAGDRTQRMQAVVDALWEGLAPRGVSWVGFYYHAGRDELICGPRRDKPACSPIGLHGVCGRAFRQREPQIVRDVRELGEDYVACDPRDQSEVVVPVFDREGRCWAVLDLDSHELAAFDEADVAGLRTVLHAAGFLV